MLPIIVLGLGAYLLYKEFTDKPEEPQPKPKKRSKVHEAVSDDGNGGRADNGGSKPSTPIEGPGGVAPKPEVKPKKESKSEPIPKDGVGNGIDNGASQPAEGPDPGNPDDSGGPES